ncbi:MAG TPA: ADOP family duplicated permease [Bryobacteraceae bacterium]|nr:ADOP family duplicated permease [Bryobacteraceae bacterium]
MLELRRALRIFVKSPGLALLAILSLALGIGANTAIFSLLNAVALRTLAAPDPGRLAALFTLDRTGRHRPFSYPAFEQIRLHQRSFSSLFLWTDAALRTIQVEGHLVPTTVLLVDGDFAGTMRLRPVLGRGIAAGDGPVAVLGYAFWKAYFRGSTAVLGKTIQVEGKPCTVVGVAPDGFTNMAASGAVDAIVPLQALYPKRGGKAVAWEITGRLKPGVTLQRARSEMEALWPQVRPDADSRIGMESAARGTGSNYQRQRFTLPLQILTVAVGLLLLLASMNLATLLLARASAQQRETGIRMALGAGRARILRQYLAESLLLAAAGSVAGVLCAPWAARFLAQFVWMTNTWHIPEVPLDGSVLAFTLAVTVASGLVFGLIPAARALRMDPSASLRQGRGGAIGGVGRTGKALVVVQFAVSLVLLVAAAWFTGTLRNLRSIPLSFNPSDLLVMDTTNRPGGQRSMNPLAYYSDLYARLAAVPGVRAVAFSPQPPVMPPLFPDQSVKAGETTASAYPFLVGPHFFETVQIPFVAGRDFTSHDTPTTPKLAIVSESLAQKLFPGSEAVGRQITVSFEGLSDLTIAGVVRDSAAGVLQRHNPLQFFVDVFQFDRPGSTTILVRSAGPPTAKLIRQLDAQVEAAGRDYTFRTETMDWVMSLALSQERLMATLGAGFGVLALLLAGIGLFGLMSYSITRRTGEIGIRMALGAGGRTILWMVLRESLVLVAAGFALSAPAICAGSKLAAGLLYGMRPLDPASLAGAAAVLLASALMAACLPARRAARLDPIAALRCE